jgi:Family of unknown function (DUF5681)
MSETTNSTEAVKSAPWLKPHHFKPGQSGNPLGRPKKTPLTDIYNELLEEGVTKNDIKKTLRAIVKQRSNVTVQALKEMADRVEGKPTERMELTGADGEPLQLTIKLVKK